MAYVHMESGDLTRALAYARQGLSLAESQGDPAMRRRALNAVGNIHMGMGQPDRALEHLRLAVITARMDQG